MVDPHVNGEPYQPKPWISMKQFWLAIVVAVVLGALLRHWGVVS